MVARLDETEAATRREKILQSARWCFLNFGFSKTSFEDIAKRTGISRTLLYKSFKDKEDIFAAVFEHWLIARHPEALAAVAGPGAPTERLFTVCRVMVLEPWADMIGAPMADEFYDVCARINPDVEAKHREVVLECVSSILADDQAALVFILALDGLLADQPSSPTLEGRVRLLIDRFVSP